MISDLRPLISAFRSQGITAKDMRLYRWVTPTLTARIGYLEWTRGERLREARFVALVSG